MQRVWKPYLTHVEYAVLEMIFDRTVGWGKEWEYISYGQFEHGVMDRDGGIVHPGCGYTRPNFSRALHELVENKRLIRRSQSGTTSNAACKYAINFTWNPQSMNLPTPKRLRAGNSTLPQVVTEQHQERLHSVITREAKEEGTNEEKQPSPDGEALTINHPPARERVSMATAAFFEQAAQRASERRAKPTRTLTRTDLGAVWQTAFRETLQGAVFTPLKEKEMGALRGYMKRWTNTTTPFAEFVDWCVRHWRQLMQSEFHWMAQPVEFPSPFFLVKFSDRFEQAYARKAVIEARTRMAPIDRLVAELHEDQGMAHEAAVVEAERRLGVARQRQQVESELAELTRQRRLLSVQQGYHAGMPPAPAPRPALTPVTGVEDFSDITCDFPETYTP